VSPGRNKPHEGGQSAVVEFWRAVELFGPQDVPKLSEKKCVYEVDGPELPWQEGHRQHKKKPGRNQAWQHVVYCGVYSMQDAHTELRDLYSDGEVIDEGPPPGDSALAVFVVADDGRVILGSEVLASGGWAISRALLGNPGSVGTGDFEKIAKRFSSEFEELMEADDDDEDASALADKDSRVGAPIDREALTECLELLKGLLKLEELDKGAALRAAREIRVRSRLVSVREAREAGERELLNSFYARDLGLVARAGSYGPALSEYLTSAEEIDTESRVDVECDLDYVRRVLSARMVPDGRWPSAPASKLALGQQLAVNTIASDTGQSMFAVNGPPGTGKTVMLRDLLAAIVVQRATLLAELDSPEEAFCDPLSWSTKSYERTVYPLREEFTGFEMVLACATNAAAENVSVEIPASDAIDPAWQGKLDYFPEIATEMLNGASTKGRQAWALISAALGNRGNNKTFVDKFWYEGLQDTLEDLGPAQNWEQAREDFNAALWRVTDVRDERVSYSDLLDDLDDAGRASWRYGELAEGARERLQEIEQELADAQRAGEQAKRECERSARALGDHRGTRPSFWERLRTFNRVQRQWDAEDTRLAADDTAATEAAEDADARATRRVEETAKLARAIEAHDEGRRVEHARAQELASLVFDAREHWNRDHPDVPFPDDQWSQPAQRERREQHPPWIDQEWNDARTELFLAALRLQKAFIEGAAPQIHDTLQTSIELISGKAPRDLPGGIALAAWQCLFLVLPLVSTTFASFPYVFRHLDQQSLGWLLIDEAGQASPQSAVGAIWRSKKVVVVGDPLQLEPIDRLPLSIQSILRKKHGLDEHWLPSDPSVQRLADRVAGAGTYRGAEGMERIWVGFPLNLHRRCEDPMFRVVNEIAYNGQMINCTPERPESPFPPSKWIDVPSTPTNGNWIPAEGEQLDELLQEIGQLKATHQLQKDFSDVFVITPFRQVAYNIAKRRDKHPGLTTGTVHVAQGREADVVILILGGNPHRPYARKWAAGKSNLLNVAISRARRRLYVIGDKGNWSKRDYFKTLAAKLDPPPDQQPPE
jgi:hypothetical protein